MTASSGLKFFSTPPHHCSYLALSDEKGDEETEPKPLVKELLLMGQPGSYLVSSSRPIRNEREAHQQVQPPHVQAKKAYERYLQQVGGRRFLVTMEEPNEKKPQPLIFEVAFGGVGWIRSALVGAGGLAASAPARAG